MTVLSRCQRFDLRRVDPETLTDHLAFIAEKENVKVARDGLWMIARAAEGSVRDALSILDQTIVQHATQSHESEEVTAKQIRDMLGLADRSGIWALLDASFKGDAKAALSEFESQYHAGADPVVILRDLLDVTHLLTRVKAAGASAASHGAAGEADAERATAMADAMAMSALTRAWSLLMKGLSETQVAPDPAASGEMTIIRLCYAANLPTPDEALTALKKNRKNALAPSKTENSAPREPAPLPRDQAPQTVIEITAPLKQSPETQPKKTGEKQTFHSFKDVVQYAGRTRDAKLRTELESYVHLVSFAPGHIDLRLHKDAPPDLAGRLTKALKDWTAKQWIVSVNAQVAGEATLRDARMAQVMAHPVVEKAMALFPGAQVTAIRDVETLDDTDADGGDLNGTNEETSDEKIEKA